MINIIFLLIAKPIKKHLINIGSMFYDSRPTFNFQNKSQKEINENLEKNNINKKKLKRPLSTASIIPIKAYRESAVETQKIDEKFYKRIPFDNLNNIDLDSLFQKQLQKLREINQSEEDEFKAKYNTIIKKDILEEKKNEDINKITSYNQKIGVKNEFVNHIKKFKSINSDLRPKSNYENIRHILPALNTTSPTNKIRIQRGIFSNRNIEEKKVIFTKNNNPQIKATMSEKSMLHKEFGKVPKYLKEMKIKEKLMKDIEKKKEEEKNYPKGTRLLSEEERQFTLKKLKESKKELENLVTKLPIALDSIGAKNRQNKLFKELDEIEQAIITFSKNKVFVKIEN